MAKLRRGEEWIDPETGEVKPTFAIITCEPNEFMATLHDRMPAILGADETPITQPPSM